VYDYAIPALQAQGLNAGVHIVLGEHLHTRCNWGPR
jgi:hypothetical protein